MKLLQILFGILSLLGTIGNGILFLYIEWMFLQQSFIQILNPFLHIRVLGIIVINPLFWLFLIMSIVGSYAVNRIEKSRKQGRRQTEISRVEISREQVKSTYPQLFQEEFVHHKQVESHQSDLNTKTDEFKHRQYKNSSTKELEKLSVSNWENTRILEIIHYELKFRDRKRAVDLRQKIMTRLAQLQEPEFLWPKTNVNPRPLNPNPPENPIDYGEGLLSHYGYKVGINGLSARERWEILDRVFLNPLLTMDNTAYLNEWGEPNSEKRLKKLANSIAAFTRNAKRRKRGNFGQAIADWEADLAYLKRTYYNNRFLFHYPHSH